MTDLNLTAVRDARKEAEAQLGTLDRALRLWVERRMREEKEKLPQETRT